MRVTTPFNTSMPVLFHELDSFRLLKLKVDLRSFLAESVDSLSTQLAIVKSFVPLHSPSNTNAADDDDVDDDALTDHRNVKKIKTTTATIESLGHLLAQTQVKCGFRSQHTHTLTYLLLVASEMRTWRTGTRGALGSVRLLLITMMMTRRRTMKTTMTTMMMTMIMMMRKMIVTKETEKKTGKVALNHQPTSPHPRIVNSYTIKCSKRFIFFFFFFCC